MSISLNGKNLISTPCVSCIIIKKNHVISIRVREMINDLTI